MRSHVDIPLELVSAFETEPVAKAKFDKIPPSHKREYIEYITEAKKPETRVRRATKTIEMLMKG